MKPDCQQVLTQFASFSVEELSDSEAASLLHHLEACEPCKGQWLLFEKTLLVTTQSGPRDEDVEQHRSQQMWLVCLEHARQRSGDAPASSQKTDVVGHAPAKLKAPDTCAEKDAFSTNETLANETSVLVAPRVGMMLVGGALLLLASSYWLAPRAQTPADRALPPMPAQLQTVGFEPLPSRAATLVDYGATLGFDALSDHVEGPLISAQTPAARAVSTVKLP